MKQICCFTLFPKKQCWTILGVTYPRGPGQLPLLDITESTSTQWTAFVRVGLGWGGVGMMTFFELEHMVDATQLCLWTKACKVNGQKKLAGTQVLDRTWMWMKKFIPHSIKNRGNSVLNPRLWDYVYQFVYRHNKDLWETTCRSKTTFCVLFHISRTSYKNRKTSDCVVNHIDMILDYANVWHHRASRRRVTLFYPFPKETMLNNITRWATWSVSKTIISRNLSYFWKRNWLGVQGKTWTFLNISES